MLNHLLINNFALIESLEIWPGKAFNVITGETGAGKSILLGALGLLMGNRVDTKAVLDENNKCIIEGEFDISALNLADFFNDNDLEYAALSIMRREIAPSGKSRAFINDTPVTLDIMRELGEKLMDIHSQNDTQALGSSAYQLGLLDTYSSNEDLLNKFKVCYKDYQDAKKDLNNLKSKASELQKEYDYNLFVYRELEKAQFTEGEQEDLENEIKVLENAEEVKQTLSQSFNLINNSEYSVVNLLKETVGLMNNLVKISPTYNQIKDRIQSSLIEIQDIGDEIEDIQDSVEINPSRLVELQDRMNLLFNLQKKHALGSIKELNEMKARLQTELHEVENFEQEIAKREKRFQETYAQAKSVAQHLSESRKENSKKFADEIIKYLVFLELPNAQIEIDITEVELNETGEDDIKILFSANKGRKPQTLKEVASGGEFSRLMLVIKFLMAKKKTLPTLIFDEIDTGVSGEVAVKMGRMMKEMSKHLQLFAITHLPQIAAMGDTHFYVYKELKDGQTFSKMKVLDENNRIIEISKMIGGNNPSESAIQSAIEMMNK